jgi:hypothetical protein
VLSWAGNGIIANVLSGYIEARSILFEELPVLVMVHAKQRAGMPWFGSLQGRGADKLCREQSAAGHRRKGRSDTGGRR